MAAKLDPSYRTAMENARKNVKKVGDEAEDSADDFGVMDIAIGNLVANGITALISKATDAARSILGLAEETREFRQDMATLETAFDDAGFTAETATGTWKDLYAIFGEDDRAVEAANNISRMAKSQEELNDWVNITTGIWGSYQDALPVESLAEAAGETAKVGKVTGALADALNWNSEAAELFSAYMSKDVTTAEDAFNEALADCTDEAQRQALIVDTLTKLYGPAADKYRETAASVMEANDAQSDYLLKQAEMGEKIEPITTALKSGWTALMGAGMDLLANVDFAAWADKITASADWIINTALPWTINTAIPFLSQNLPIIATVLGGVTAAIIAQTAATKLKTIADTAAEKGMTLATYAQKGLNAAMKANAIGIIITGITLLVGAFMYLWNNCEGFRNFFINMWAGIKNIAASVASWFTDTFVPWISGVWTLISDAVTNWYNTFLAPIVEGIKRLFGGIIDFVAGIFTGDWQRVWQGVVDIFGGIFDTLVGYVKMPLNGVIKVLNWFIRKANNISIGPLPDWDILGQYAGATIGFDIPEIPALAQGGIATAPTLAMIGEGNEDEAVLPLSKLGDLMESTETISIVYAPNITVMPGANGADVKAATTESFEQFKAYMDRYLRERKRVQFA